MVDNVSRRDFLKRSGAAAAFSLAGAGLLSGCGANFASKPKAPLNIVFLFSDDHAYQAISAYKDRLASIAPTPNIDRLADDGMIFNKAYVTNSICAPSRAVIQTGKHSHINGLIDNNVRFDNEQQTFPKILRQNGYQTAIVGKWHLKSDPTGFDYWQVLPDQGHYYNPDFLTPAGKITEHGYVTDIITDKALGWLESRDKTKPFMLMIQHKAPHREWEPATENLTLFDDVTIPEPESLFDDYATRGTAAHTQDMTIRKTMKIQADNKVWDKDPAKRGPAWKWTYDRMDKEQRAAWDAAYEPKNEAFRQANLSGDELVRWKYQRYMKDYLRCIRSVDDNVGRVLDYLDAQGLAGNTLVMYSSDQGFYLGEHGWFDKRFMYEESFRTPLLARLPGVIKPKSSCDELVQNLDYAETFLDAAGITPPADMQGASLLPLMAGHTPKNWRRSLYYHYYEYPAVHSVRKHEGVATKRYKLMHFYNLDEWEFYDLQTDPHEMNNLYGDPACEKQIEELKRELIRLKELYKVPQ